VGGLAEVKHDFGGLAVKTRKTGELAWVKHNFGRLAAQFF
jgi:hypothetical protein